MGHELSQSRPREVQRMRLVAQVRRPESGINADRPTRHGRRAIIAPSVRQFCQDAPFHVWRRAASMSL
jgi:hypothetical protein